MAEGIQRDYVIRACTLVDLPAVRDLSALWVAEDITRGLVVPPTEWGQDRLDRYFWIAELDGQIVGYACGKAHTSTGLAVIPAGEQYIDVDELYVHPDHRRRGVGSRLFERLLEEARAHGVERALVTTATKDWARVVAFYQRHGFGVWYVQMFR